MVIHRNKEWDWMDEIESRPWGMYEVLLDSDECKVKRITVAPGQKLSYQYHHKSIYLILNTLNFFVILNL